MGKRTSGVDGRHVVPVVYFGRRETGGPIKIGCTTRLESRACNLRIDILAILPGYRVREGFLHSAFAPWRLQGEWFDPADALQQVIGVIHTVGDLSWMPAEPSREASFGYLKQAAARTRPIRGLTRRECISAHDGGRLLFLEALRAGRVPECISIGHTTALPWRRNGGTDNGGTGTQRAAQVDRRAD